MYTEEEIISQIKNNELIKRYKELEEVINNNEKIQEQLTNLKNIQKEIVHAESLNKQTILNKLKKDYDEQLQKFHEIPLISEYLDLQLQINDFLQNFTAIIEENIKKDLK